MDMKDIYSVSWIGDITEADLQNAIAGNQTGFPLFSVVDLEPLELQFTHQIQVRVQRIDWRAFLIMLLGVTQKYRWHQIQGSAWTRSNCPVHKKWYPGSCVQSHHQPIVGTHVKQQIPRIHPEALWFYHWYLCVFDPDLWKLCLYLGFRLSLCWAYLHAWIWCCQIDSPGAQCEVWTIQRKNVVDFPSYCCDPGNFPFKDLSESWLTFGSLLYFFVIQIVKRKLFGERLLAQAHLEFKLQM